MSLMDNITVSIICDTYNHEKYISQCLDGFMMQKTNFAFEVLIHDDASTDNTANIIREYESKYPNVIKPIYQTENQYSKGASSYIWKTYQLPRAKGEYIAMCEGDDYWTDPNKLQKQVDFLENNEDYSICFHSVKIWKEEEQKLVNDYITKEVPETTTIVDLANGNYIHTPSVMYRYNKKVLNKLRSLSNFSVGDYVLHMLNAKYGKIKKLPNAMAVYRVHSGGVWSEKAFSDKAIKWVKMIEKIKPLFVGQNIDDILTNQQLILLSNELQDEIEDKNKQLASKIFNTYIECGLSERLFELFYLSQIQLNNVRKSKAYRLGKMILKSFLFIRNRLKNDSINSGLYL